MDGIEKYIGHYLTVFFHLISANEYPYTTMGAVYAELMDWFGVIRGFL